MLYVKLCILTILFPSELRVVNSHTASFKIDLTLSYWFNATSLSEKMVITRVADPDLVGFGSGLIRIWSDLDLV